ncbi:MAG: hypothetical protein ACXVBR_12245 [Flavisolibacter sp.]
MKQVIFKTAFLMACVFLFSAVNGVNTSRACDKNVCLRHCLPGKKMAAPTRVPETAYPDMILTNALLRF